MMIMIPRVYQPDAPPGERAEEGFAPPAEAVARMMKFNEELAKTADNPTVQEQIEKSKRSWRGRKGGIMKYIKRAAPLENKRAINVPATKGERI